MIKNIQLRQEIQLKNRKDYKENEYKSIRYFDEEYENTDKYKKITHALKAESIQEIQFIKMRTINTFIINLEKKVSDMRKIQMMLINVVAK